MRKCGKCDKPPRRSMRRGMCEACYLQAYRAGELEDYPLQCHDSDDTATLYENLLSKHPNLNLKQAAAMLNMKYSTLRVALSRSRRRHAS